MAKSAAISPGAIPVIFDPLESALTYCEKRGRGGEGQGKVDPLNLRITLYWKSGKKSKIN